MFVKRLLKYLFTWWNGNTVGTKLYTFLKGKKVGEDYFGNFYYESKDQKNRWCIYSDQSEASRISPEWNSWLRFISNTLPTGNNFTFEWQKPFDGNRTGLDSAYKPSTKKVDHLKEDLVNYHSDYKAWKPE
ncbi:NADH-ubiquinone oxidoreductase subunit NDUFA12 family protein [Paracoccaceae bacterium]|nr:NADH-ubiquinone oxidoreductase subunit NDUFA12 family protein [Paracoccaceae bacterium]